MRRETYEEAIEIAAIRRVEKRMLIVSELMKKKTSVFVRSDRNEEEKSVEIVKGFDG